MSRRLRLAFFGVLAFQLLFLLGLVTFKEVTVRIGQTVVLQTVPVDPRDLFRGDYVILGYKISTIVGGPPPASTPTPQLTRSYRVPDLPYISRGDTVYVKLEESSDEGVWVPTAVSRGFPSDWTVFIKGTATSASPGHDLTVRYGIESYFVPEGQGRVIERASDVKVEAAVNGFGDAVIKGLIVDGEPFRLR